MHTCPIKTTANLVSKSCAYTFPENWSGGTHVLATGKHRKVKTETETLHAK